MSKQDIGDGNEDAPPVAQGHSTSSETRVTFTSWLGLKLKQRLGALRKHPFIAAVAAGLVAALLWAVTTDAWRHWTEAKPLSVLASAMSDVDGDDRPDLVVVTHDRRLVAYLGRAGGEGFDLTNPFQSTGLWDVQRLAVIGDAFGDGSPDLAVMGRNGRVTVHRQSATAVFAQSGRRLDNEDIRDVSGVGDATGDGVDDLAVLLDEGALVVYPGYPGEQLFSGRGAIRVLHSSTSTPFGTGNIVSILGVGDVIEDDGQTDVAALATDGSLTVHPGRGDGTFEPRINTRVSRGWDDALVVTGVGDVEDDGTVDILAMNGGILSIHANLGDGQFSPDGATITTEGTVTGR